MENFLKYCLENFLEYCLGKLVNTLWDKCKSESCWSYVDLGKLVPPEELNKFSFKTRLHYTLEKYSLKNTLSKNTVDENTLCENTVPKNKKEELNKFT